MRTIEDRTAVLRALADGTITVAEAEDRLAVLDEVAADPLGTPSHADRERGRSGRGDARRGGRPSVDDVIALAAHGVDASYLKALRKAGFGHLETEDIIRLADHGAEPEWLRAIHDAGIEADVDNLVKMVDHGVEAEWIQQVRRAGIDADADDLVRLVDHGVEAAWLAQVPAAILRDLDVDDLVSLADNGVEPADLEVYLDLRRDDDG